MTAVETIMLEVELPAFFPKDEARLMMATKLFEAKRLTLGQAARAAGMSRRAFIEVLGRMGVPVIDYPAEELAEELTW